jgi:hypothetical protein
MSDATALISPIVAGSLQRAFVTILQAEYQSWAMTIADAASLSVSLQCPVGCLTRIFDP